MTISLVTMFGVGFNRDPSWLPMFAGTEIFHIFDIFTNEYITKVVEQKGRPRAIVNDHILSLCPEHTLHIDFYGLPLWAMRECRQWSKIDFDDAQPLVTDYAFNFMVNKAQCSRQILIKMVELNRYENFQYTWSGAGRNFDMSEIIKEMDLLGSENPASTAEFRSHILSPIDMSSRFVEKDTILAHPEKLLVSYGNIEFKGAKITWDDFLHDMFSRSAVSLIGETCVGYDKIAVLTEKTLYAFFGLTFPIWVGNYGQAQAVEQVGFDVFHDVIDHDYQWYPTLIERCYWAFELNKEILSDLTRAKKTRLEHFDRLLRNRKFILADGLGNYCDQQIQQLPDQYRDPVTLIKQKFDSTKSDITKI